MKESSLMQQVLGDQWRHLPPALKAHYALNENTDVGYLSIEYPSYMQWYLNILKLFGALINQQGNEVPTEVQKKMLGGTQYWHRTIRFADKQPVTFKSRWQYYGPNELIEYVNPVMGLRMKVIIKGSELHYQGVCMVLRLAKWYIPIPEWLFLGHTTIVETALDDKRFKMDFKMTHPLVGCMFRYYGKFQTVQEDIVQK